MKRKYQTPVIEIIEMEMEDIITESQPELPDQPL